MTGCGGFDPGEFTKEMRGLKHGGGVRVSVKKLRIICVSENGMTPKLIYKETHVFTCARKMYTNTHLPPFCLLSSEEEREGDTTIHTHTHLRPPARASLDGTAVGSGVALLAAGGQVEEHRREHGGGGQNQRLGEGPVGSVEREREGVDEAHHRPEALGQLEYGEGGDAVGRREERPDHRVDLPGDQWLSA